jgi:WD40 repeat protein
VASARYTAHASTINGAAFSPDGARVATVDQEGALHLWSRQDGTAVAQKRLRGSLWAVAYAPDGREIVVAGDSGVIHRMTPDLAEAGQLPGHAQRIWSLVYSPDGATLASSSEDTTIRLWNLATGVPRTLAGHAARVYGVGFSPDGARLASASDDRSVFEWDLATGHHSERGRHANGGVRAATYTPDGTLVTTGWEYKVSVWPAGGGEPISWPTTHSTHGFALTPDQRVAITAGDSGTIQFWDLTTHRLVTALDAPGGRMHTAVVSRDGKWLVTAGQDRAATVWSLEAVPRVADVVGHAGLVTSARFTADGRRFITGGHDRTLRIWDAATMREQLRLSNGASGCHEAPFFLGEDILAGCEGARIQRFDRSGRPSAAFSTAPIRTEYGSLSPDGRRYAGGHTGGLLGVFDVATGQKLLEKKLHDHHIESVTYLSDGRLLTSALDNKVKLWSGDLELVRELAVETLDGVLAAVMSPDLATLAAGGQDGIVEAWSASTGARLARFRAHAGTIWEMAFLPDGSAVVTSGEDGLVKLWSPQTWQLAATLDAREGAVMALAASPDARSVVVGHRSGAIVVWDVATRVARHRVGGNSRDHGSCDDLAQQKWVDAEHERIVRAACASEPAQHLERFARRSHQRIRDEIDVEMDWR